jgi:sulfur-oxidizing protein SoxY
MIKRREFLQNSVTAVFATMAGASLLRAPRADAATIRNVPGWPNAFGVGAGTGVKAAYMEAADKALMESVGTTHVPISSRIKISAPTVAENGGSVPVTVSVDWPMTPDNYIEALYMYVFHNPTPLVSEYHLTPANGEAYFSERIKMAKTDHIRVIAKTNKGKLMAAVPREVKVTIGGCGG